MGRLPYRGVFALITFSALGMIIYGWQVADPGYVYTPPAWGLHVNNALMVLAILLMTAAEMPTRIKRWVRHPMLSGMVLWAVAHLLANGDQKSVVMFSVLGLWSALAIVLINRRDGPWQKPEPASAKQDFLVVAGGLVATAVIIGIHMFLGLAPIPGA